MLAYIVLYFQGVFSFVASSLDREHEKAYCLLFAVGLLFIAMFRYQVGVDYEAYLRFIRDIFAGQETYMEYGFEALARLVNLIGGTEQLVLVIISFLTVFLFLKFVIENSRRPALSLFLYLTLPPLYLASFNGIRQFLGVACFAYAIKFILERSLYKYLLVLFFASTIHVTSILMIPFYFFLEKKLKVYHMLILGVCYITLLQFVEMLLPMMGIFSGYLEVASSEGVSGQAFILLFLSIFLVSIRDKLISNNNSNNVFINLVLIGTLISFTPMFTSLPVGEVTRMTSYFTFSLVIIIPEVLFLFKQRQVKVIYLSSVIFVSTSYYFFTILEKGIAYKLIPYNLSFKLF